MVKDMITRYYDKRETPKNRKYYIILDELFIKKGRIELIGKNIIPSWMGIKTIEILK